VLAVTLRSIYAFDLKALCGFCGTIEHAISHMVTHCRADVSDHYVLTAIAFLNAMHAIGLSIGRILQTAPSGHIVLSLRPPDGPICNFIATYNVIYETDCGDDHHFTQADFYLTLTPHKNHKSLIFLLIYRLIQGRRKHLKSGSTSA